MGKCRFSFVGDHSAQGLVPGRPGQPRRAVSGESGEAVAGGYTYPGRPALRGARRDFVTPLSGYAPPSAGKSYTGKRAELILFTLENGKIVIQKAIIAGNAVYSAKGN